ncbi:50S ribosomal protein L24 [Candidatus Amesbacteria bacterium RIFCSPHIGHO2_02_FULL_47_9]|uniref:Large ribosomal subunit protein uL24 n=2 Tax=Microgenomates group TaxID=1794810 RepID=A0A0H4TUG2_9BACT|nr:50S ribosomal protein L24, large subunit ribosomal protein L24 [uncultured Microgenomates bacterium Rifle_16ft_4_minimus_5815]OGC93033.1 MAG: 50S ribosomal protein L24 [Candidatus Amesbacteria bacterium RIFCSPHIGHO2_01_FULL_48_32b]OGD05194.1 MAG: 50S ribosomal protein L24 [Candidatus Amesbacteria bacterium RIFCSPHIGHO2_02_FULL_47_9]OGD07482.1 MAG: 50S ribosomal protein L24 [Candidatus Amesbacteria bacterium RIFCSPLOWO2_01_FULL_49_25]
MKIRKGDLVKITAGKDKGREGKVERVFSRESRVLVPGVNQYKKHIKPQGEGRPGDIVTLSRPMPMGNVALICPKCKQVTRVGYQVTGEKKVRICRKCMNLI